MCVSFLNLFNWFKFDFWFVRLVVDCIVTGVWWVTAAAAANFIFVIVLTIATQPASQPVSHLVIPPAICSCSKWSLLLFFSSSFHWYQFYCEELKVSEACRLWVSATREPQKFAVNVIVTKNKTKHSTAKALYWEKEHLRRNCFSTFQQVFVGFCLVKANLPKIDGAWKRKESFGQFSFWLMNIEQVWCSEIAILLMFRKSAIFWRQHVAATRNFFSNILIYKWNNNQKI